MGIIIKTPQGSREMIQQVAEKGHPNVLASSTICYVPQRGPTTGNKLGTIAPKPMMESSHGLREELCFWEG